MTDGLLIDLGELRRDGRNPVLERASERPGARRRAPLIALALALAVLAGLTMNSSRRAPQLVEIATIQYDRGGDESQFMLEGDRLYVRSAGITAYRLADGARLWRVQSGTGQAAGMFSSGGNVIAVSGECESLSDVTVSALDPRTGREVWRQPGRPIGRLVGGGLAVETAMPGSGCDNLSPDLTGPVSGPVRRIRILDPSSGRVVWSLPDASWLAVQTGLDMSGDIASIVIAEVTGAVSSIDPATGRASGTAHIPEVAEAYQQQALRNPVAGMSVVGDLFVVMVAQEDSIAVTAYSVGSLQRRWTRRFATGPLQNGPETSIWYGPCGRLVCLHAASATFALEPATGDIRWRLSGLEVIVSAERWLLLGNNLESTGNFRMIDSWTGRITMLAAGFTSGIVALDSRRLVMSYTGLGTTAFTVFDMTNRQLRFLGRVRGLYQYCQLSGRYLVCEDGRTGARIWRVAE